MIYEKERESARFIELQTKLAEAMRTVEEIHAQLDREFPLPEDQYWSLMSDDKLSALTVWE